MTYKAGNISTQLFEKATQLIPGGVNSPVRAFKAVGGTPFFVKKAQGPFVIDVDDNRYIDFMGSWGPLILGHAPKDIHDKIIRAAQDGTSFGAPHAAEIELAQLVVDMVPSIEMVRLVSSGTEATMSAIRLARGYTHRSKILKFEGCYHGHADSFLIKAGSGAATFGQPNSPGVTPGTVSDTLVADYNDLASVEKLFTQNKDDVAAVIVEPVAGNMGCVLPAPGFLKGLRSLCDKHDALLIFDEVITGFRLAEGGAQQYYDVRPDLTTLGKILGGGFPVGAFGGSKKIMSQMSPTGPVYQAGTLSGNPVAVAAGIGTLSKLKGNRDLYQSLADGGKKMEDILRDSAKAVEVEITINRVGSMLGFFFNPGPVTTWSEVEASNAALYSTLFSHLLSNGVSIAPSAYESLFVSTEHTPEILGKAKTAFEAAFAAVGQLYEDN